MIGRIITLLFSVHFLLYLLVYLRTRSSPLLTFGLALVYVYSIGYRVNILLGEFTLTRPRCSQALFRVL